VRVFFDTSVLVAAMVDRHPRHARAMPPIRRVLDRRDVGIVSAHSLAETYAVVTSLPLSPRIGPEAAHRLVHENLVGRFEIVALTAREYERLLEALPERGAAGGSVYDALQIQCAVKAGAERIYTFDVSDFSRLAPDWSTRIASP